jgi:hypothetical protein
MEELKADFDRYVEVSNRIDALKDCEIKHLKGTISQQEATIQLMERLLNNKEK